MSPEAKEIAGAIKHHESQGDCTKPGKSKERGCYQFMESTWKLYSEEVAGRVLPMTPENEEYVALKMIQKWLDDGMSTANVVLRWNHPAGVVHGCGSGVNSHGVAWDSCAYQRKVLALL